MKKVVAFSGGKDSTAMLLRLLELGEQIDDIIFADTGFEFPELYTYIKRIEDHIKRKITVVQPNKDFWLFASGEVTRGSNKGEIRGLPLRAYPCWWTRESKVVPLSKLQKDADIVYIGIAKDEEKRVSKEKDHKYRYPLVEWGWSEQDCINYLNEKGLFNPLYANFNRLGCYWCPKQSESSLYVLWKNYPDLWIKTKSMEEWNTKQGKGLLFNFELNKLEEKFKKGKVPKKLPKYECWNGCEGVKKAFTMKQCDLFQFT